MTMRPGQTQNRLIHFQRITRIGSGQGKEHRSRSDCKDHDHRGAGAGRRRGIFRWIGKDTNGIYAEERAFEVGRILCHD